MTPSFLLLTSLAVWRVASLFAAEDGPWEIFAHFRTWVGVRYDQRGEMFGKNEFAKALTCVWCLSLWIAAIFYAAYLLLPLNIYNLLTVPLALSAAAIALNTWSQK